METRKNQQNDREDQNPGAQQNMPANTERDNARALDEAEKDINNDAELSVHSPNDDLDEGETARLGEGENPLV